MKRVLFSLLGLALTSAVALAEVPDPTFCDVQPGDALNGLLLGPDVPAPIPASINTITVRNSSNSPIANASVVVTLAGTNVECGSSVLTGTTDINGEVVITLRGGGCAHAIPLSALVKANGVTIRNYQNSKSPDYDGASGSLAVDLSDLIKFANEFLAVDPSECHDYDNDGSCGLGDLIIFSTPFSNGNSCAP